MRSDPLKGVKEEDTMRLEMADRAMIRWICGISFRDGILLRDVEQVGFEGH